MSNNSRLKVLEGYKILIDGFDEKEYAKLQRLVNHLGGSLAPSYRKDLSCVVVKRVGSTSCSYASNDKIPMVTYQWIVDCNMQKKWLSFENYLAPAFLGLEIVCTRLPKDKRVEIGNIVIRNGGKFSFDLVKDQTTHLVSPDCEGEKFKHATEWGISIVLPAWIQKCADERRKS